MENELKPCPFCDGEAHIYQTEHDGEIQVQAQCKGCGAEIAFWLPWTADAGQKISAWMDVERRWNARATIAGLEARVEALKEALANAAADLDGAGEQLSEFANILSRDPWEANMACKCAQDARAALSGGTPDATHR